MCGFLSPIFHFGPLYRAEGQVYICVTDCKADVACKDNYCFPRVSAIKNIMLPYSPGKKGGKGDREAREKRAQICRYGDQKTHVLPDSHHPGGARNWSGCTGAPRSGKPQAEVVQSQ